MKKILILSALLLSVYLHPSLSQTPYFELRNLDNEWVTFEDVRGENLTVIDFWATWCQPCLRSIPELNEIYLEYRDEGVGFVGISVDGPRNQSKLKPFVSSMGIVYTVVRDINSEVMSEMNVTAVPTLLILDDQGEVVYTHEGYRPGDEDFIRKEIKALL